jgi:uncharacterized protein (TIGR02001 family)
MKSVRKLIGLALLASAASVATAGVASAEGEVSGNVALTSNYVWRGVTQSDSGFAVQGGLDYASEMFYVGTWASSVDDFGIDASTELDVYAGFTPSVGPVSFDIGVIGYFYPEANTDSDFIELALGASYSPIEALSLGVGVYLSDDYLATGDESVYIEGTVGYAINDTFSVSAGYGNFDQGSTLGEYDTWNIGGTVSAFGFGFDLRYSDVDGLGLGDEVAFTISRAL